MKIRMGSHHLQRSKSAGIKRPTIIGDSTSPSMATGISRSRSYIGTKYQGLAHVQEAPTATVEGQLLRNDEDVLDL